MPEWLYFQYAVNFGGADEIVWRQAADTVCAVFDAAGIVADVHLGMVVLTVCHHGYDINKGHGVVIVFKIENTVDGFFVFGELPFWRDLAHEPLRLFRFYAGLKLAATRS